jgi:hypothetical protein
MVASEISKFKKGLNDRNMIDTFRVNKLEPWSNVEINNLAETTKFV